MKAVVSMSAVQGSSRSRRSRPILIKGTFSGTESTHEDKISREKAVNCDREGVFFSTRRSRCTF